MTLYIRKSGQVADGSVTAPKLATGSVDLSTDKVTGQAPSSKIADSAIIESKLGALAISSGKLQDDCVSLAKAQVALKMHDLVGDETEKSVTGVTEVSVKTFKIIKSSANTSGVQAEKLHCAAEVKSSLGTATASLKVYVDTALKITLTSVSTTYEIQQGTADISALAVGKHDVEVKLVSDTAGETSYNDMIQFWIEK